MVSGRFHSAVVGRGRIWGHWFPKLAPEDQQCWQVALVDQQWFALAGRVAPRQMADPRRSLLRWPG